MPREYKPTWLEQLKTWQMELARLEKSSSGSSYDKMLIEHAKERIRYLRKKARQLESTKSAREPKKGSPKKGNPSPLYRVCARTTSGGWANKATDLTAAEADRLMAKLKREGFEVAKFKGRKRVK